MDPCVEQPRREADIDWKRVEPMLDQVCLLCRLLLAAFVKLTLFVLQVERVHFNLVDGQLPYADKIQEIYEKLLLPPTWNVISMCELHSSQKLFGFYIVFKDPKMCESCLSTDGRVIAERALYLGKLLRAADRDNPDTVRERSAKKKCISWLQLFPELAAAVSEANKRDKGMPGRNSPVGLSGF